MERERTRQNKLSRWIMLKPLLPSLREKKRYLFYEVLCDRQVKKEDARKAIKQAILRYAGIKGAAEAGAKFVKTDLPERKGVLRISHKSPDTVKAALALMQKIGNQPAIVKSFGMSATLKKGLQKYA